jgi:hypothetical protein
VRYSFADRRRTPLGENQTLRVALEELAPANPLVVEEAEPEGDGWLLHFREFHDNPPELHGEILQAPQETRLAGHGRRRTLRRLCLAVAAAVLATTLFWPPVLTACQWCLDLLTF